MKSPSEKHEEKRAKKVTIEKRDGIIGAFRKTKYKWSEGKEESPSRAVITQNKRGEFQ